MSKGRLNPTRKGPTRLDPKDRFDGWVIQDAVGRGCKPGNHLPGPGVLPPVAGKPAAEVATWLAGYWPPYPTSLTRVGVFCGSGMTGRGAEQ